MSRPRLSPKTRLGRFLFGAPDQFDEMFSSSEAFNSARFSMERALAEYQARPRRQHVARELARHGRVLRRRLRDLPSSAPGGGLWRLRYNWANDRHAFLPDTLRQRLIERELTEARTLRYTSHYVHTKGETSEVEGYFALKSGPYSLDVLTPRFLSDIAEEQWDAGELGYAPNARALIVPGDFLDDEIVLEALKRWYIERYSWKYDHWAIRESRLPDIVVDLAWSEPEGERVSGRELLKEHNERLRDARFRPFGRDSASAPKPLYRD